VRVVAAENAAGPRERPRGVRESRRLDPFAEPVLEGFVGQMKRPVVLRVAEQVVSLERRQTA
jgi:hypothetical protein